MGYEDTKKTSKPSVVVTGATYGGIGWGISKVGLFDELRAVRCGMQFEAFALYVLYPSFSRYFLQVCHFRDT